MLKVAIEEVKGHMYIIFLRNYRRNKSYCTIVSKLISFVQTIAESQRPPSASRRSTTMHSTDSLDTVTSYAPCPRPYS